MELAKIDAQSHTMKNILRRLGQKDDPWRDMWRHAVRLESASERLRKLMSSTDGR